MQIHVFFWDEFWFPDLYEQKYRYSVEGFLRFQFANNGQTPIIPTIFTDSRIGITLNGESFELEAGKNFDYNISLPPGMSEVSLSGFGTVEFQVDEREMPEYDSSIQYEGWTTSLEKGGISKSKVVLRTNENVMNEMPKVRSLFYAFWLENEEREPRLGYDLWLYEKAGQIPIANESNFELSKKPSKLFRETYLRKYN